MMQRIVLALAGASMAAAAPQLAVPPVALPVPTDVTGTVTGAVNDAAGAVTTAVGGAPAIPAADLPGLLAGLLGSTSGLKMRVAGMSEEEIQAMEQIENTISEVIAELESLQGNKVQRRQLDILSGLLGSLGLGNLLGKVDVADMTVEESELMHEASDIVMQLAHELQGQVAQKAQGVQRRQLELLSGLPIVGPLLSGLLGGVLGGGGPVGGILGGVTGGGGPLGAVTGTLGGLTGGLGGLGGLTGGLTGILGKVKAEDINVTDDQLARARKAEEIFEHVEQLLEQSHAN